MDATLDQQCGPEPLYKRLPDWKMLKEVGTKCKAATSTKAGGSTHVEQSSRTRATSARPRHTNIWKAKQALALIHLYLHRKKGRSRSTWPNRRSIFHQSMFVTAPERYAKTPPLHNEAATAAATVQVMPSSQPQERWWAQCKISNKIK